MKWKVWFGTIENEEIEVSKNLIESFEKASNDEPLPFNLFEYGLKVFQNEKEYYRKLRQVAIESTEKKVEKEIKREDKYAIALVKALEEVEEAINLLKEKLEDLSEIKEDELVKDFKEKIKSLEGLLERIEKEIDDVMKKISPNVTEIAGSKIAAKLLERAGSFEKLISLPASKIQIIGAEKSLYKALARMRRGKTAKIPKHGVIFIHPFIRTLPKSKRGKMARFLAAKIAIAAKIDYFRGEVEEELYEAVRKRYEELRRK
ncbi:MAG: RNA-processing protein [Archaeoglobaceae archaeon]|nr:RNA-processing protein [Archaeoglobaceae archaeon]MCX8152796.1 RNA-processing protein [Archaeoglobaceae archaeon]MDW8013503.1 RNA-processing protein [Archaeoglobaceae archaeon]